MSQEPSIAINSAQQAEDAGQLTIGNGTTRNKGEHSHPGGPSRCENRTTGTTLFRQVEVRGPPGWATVKEPDLGIPAPRSSGNGRGEP